MRNKIKKIAIVGCGHIGEQILSRLKREADFRFCSFAITRRNKKKGETIAKKYKVKYSKENFRAVEEVNIVWLCVGPDQIAKVIQQITPTLKKNCIVFSVAVAISQKYIATLLPKQVVIRYMPSPLFKISKGVALISGPSNAEFEYWKKILKGWSSDLIAVKASCSSAFYAAIFNHLLLCAQRIRSGLTDEKLKTILSLVGADTFTYLQDKNIKEVQKLIKNAATPGGMTEAGLKILNSPEVGAMFEQTISKTVSRSKTLQKSYEK